MGKETTGPNGNTSGDPKHAVEDDKATGKQAGDIDPSQYQPNLDPSRYPPDEDE